MTEQVTAAQIRAQIEILAEQYATNGAIDSPEWCRLSQAWESIKPKTDVRYHQLIEDRLKAFNPQPSWILTAQEQRS